MLITGNVMIDGRHLEKPGNVIIDPEWASVDGKALTSWADAAKSGAGQAWLQLSHPGRQASKVATPSSLSASDVSLPVDRYPPTRPMTHEEIENVTDRFVLAAEIALQAGFTGIQIHAAHGYLLSQFLSPLANLRNDEWGGSLENRARLLLRVTRGIRALSPSTSLAVKLNSADFQKGGFSFEEARTILGWLSAEGVDIVELSGGNAESAAMVTRQVSDQFVPDSTKSREAYFLEFVKMIRGDTKMPIMLTGGFRTPNAISSAIASNEIELAGLARPFCDDPDKVMNMIKFGSDNTIGIDVELEQAVAGALPEGLDDETRFMMTVQGAFAWRAMKLLSLGKPDSQTSSVSPSEALAALTAFEHAQAQKRQEYRSKET